MHQIKRLAIIPARKGSKRIKNKNLKKFHQKPLIFYPLKAIIESKLFNKIHVSSDCHKILKYTEKFDLHTDFVRPKSLSGDIIGLDPVINYVVNQYKKRSMIFDQVWLIYATNPFINSLIIKKCENKFKKISTSSEDSLITVTKYNYPIQWAQKIKENGSLEPFDKKYLKIRSQDLTETYCDAGMINIYSGEKFLKKTKKINYFPFEISRLESFDIDTKHDFIMASKLFQIKNV